MSVSREDASATEAIVASNAAPDVSLKVSLTAGSWNKANLIVL